MTIQRRAPQYYRSITGILVMMCVGLIISSCVWTNKVSVGISGEQGTGNSLRPAISGDGRYVVFDSWARNLVQGDTNASSDIFLRDTYSGTTSVISVSSTGTPANSHSLWPSISDDGRYVVYASAASNLVAGDVNNAYDIFLYDRDTATTSRISVDSNGIAGNGASNNPPSISADGRYIVFSSFASNLVTGDTNSVGDVFLHDRISATTTRVSINDQGNEGNGPSGGGSLSDDGRYIAFSSSATNLVAQGSPFSIDIFVHDQTNGITTLVSVDTAGNMGSSVEEPSISGDGRFVSFTSTEEIFTQHGFFELRDVFVHDRNTSTTSLISVPGHQNTHGSSPALSVDGRYVAFHSPSSFEAGDTNNAEDVYVHDRNTGTTNRVSLASSGAQTDRSSQNALFSTDGRYVAFQTWPLINDPNGGDTADVVIRAFPALTVTSIVPRNLQVSATTPVTITGTNFLPEATPRIEGGQFSDLVIVDENTITVNVTVPAGTPTGTQDVLVDLPGTGPGPLAGAIGRCTSCVKFLPPALGC